MEFVVVAVAIYCVCPLTIALSSRKPHRKTSCSLTLAYAKRLVEIVEVLEAAHLLRKVDRDLLEDAFLGVEDHGVDAGDRGAGGLGGLHALLLHNTGLQHVDGGLNDVKLNELEVLCLIALDLVKLSSVDSGHVADAAQPVLQEAEVLSLQGGYRRVRGGRTERKCYYRARHRNRCGR